MIINTICGSAYNVEGQVTATTANTATVPLQSKPLMILVVGRDEIPLSAAERITYAFINPETNEYVSREQSGAKGSTVSWVDRTSHAVWDDVNMTMTVYISCSVGTTITYHAVG